MRYGVVDAYCRNVRMVECDTLADAKNLADLDGVDFGTAWDGVGIVVYEYGLFESDKLHHFSIGKKLFAGNAVLFEYDEGGETTALSDEKFGVICRHIRFFENKGDVLCAIEIGDISCPVISVNNEVLWRWPMPAPSFFHNIQDKSNQ